MRVFRRWGRIGVKGRIDCSPVNWPHEPNEFQGFSYNSDVPPAGRAQFCPGLVFVTFNLKINIDGDMRVFYRFAFILRVFALKLRITSN